MTQYGFGNLAEVLTSNGPGILPSFQTFSGGGGTGLNPSNPAFEVYLAAPISNVTGNGTVYSVLFDTIKYDQTSNITLNSSGLTIFTAPTTAKYLMNFTATFTGVSATNTTFQMRLTTTSLTYLMRNQNPGVVQSGGNYMVQFSKTVTMSAGDTCSVQVYMAGSVSDNISLYGDANFATFWEGVLIT